MLSFQASYYSKLEKADILEMAVDHVRNLQKQIRTGEWNSQLIDCKTTLT